MPRTKPLLVPLALAQSLDALRVHLAAKARAIAVVTDSVEASGADLVAVVELLDVIMKLGASGRAPRLRPERGDPSPARSALVAEKSRKKPALSRAGAGPNPGPTQRALARGSLYLAALATARAAGAASKTGCHRPESLAPEPCGNAGLPGD